jgi:hypothetical protein
VIRKILAATACFWALQTLAQDGERLSSYLLKIPVQKTDFLFGAEWITPESRQAQAAVHRSLLLSVSSIPSNAQVETLSENDRARWQEWLSEEKPRGRVRIPSFDARWLQANPALDPILGTSHEVRIPKRPGTVTVIKNSGELCKVQFEISRSVLDYADVCEEKLGAGDWAHIVQPDGEVHRFGIASWNQTSQLAPAPGAWIWLPSKQMDWPQSFNDRLMKFLSHQGVAKDPADNSVKAKSLPSETRSIGRYQDLKTSASDWGSIGLLQTPTARFSEPGYGSITFSATQPYTRASIILTPFDWMEAGFRYTDVSNRLYGPEIAGSQSYKDKSIDVKFRLVREDAFFPQLALGLRDLGGTGLFSGEYLVASKRFGPFDTSLGLGWGYLGGRGDIGNPLGFINKKFKDRPKGSTGSNQGGEFNAVSYLRGPVALFGGVQYQTPWDRWLLKLELDGNDYQSEPQNNNQKQNSAVNLGAVYRLGPHSQITIGIERGNTITLGVSFGTNLGRLSTPKINEARPLPVAIERPKILQTAMPQEAWLTITKALQEQTGWTVSAVTRRDKSLRIEIASAPTFEWFQVIDRANRVLHAFAPRDVSRFDYIVLERGLPLAELSVERAPWAAQASSFVAPKIRLGQPDVIDEVVAIGPVRHSFRDEPILKNERDHFSSGLGLSYSQSLGGPDAFILFQLAAQAEAELRISSNSWVTGVARLSLADNYDKFQYTAPSKLPRVRTQIREFVTSSDLTLPLLQATHTRSLSSDWSASIYGGLLEYMYAGAGGELLYKPFGSRYALGFDLNRVRQRGFKQDFSLRDYEVTTGHATLYWNTPWQNIVAKLSAGQYLAGDRGVTVDLSRQFPNGVRIGAFATRTNVSAEDFGEGSFDKGIYISIPFDAMMTKYSKAEALILWQPLTRDGGARLGRRFQLYELKRVGGQ